MNAQGITIEWQLPPPFQVVAPFREIRCSQLPAGTTYCPLDEPEIVAAIAIAEVARTMAESAINIIDHTPDPEARLRIIARVYTGGAHMGLTELDAGEVRRSMHAGVVSLRHAAVANAWSALSVRAALALASHSGAAWFSQLLELCDLTTQAGRVAFCQSALIDSTSIGAYADAEVARWHQAQSPTLADRFTLPVLRPAAGGQPVLAIFPASYVPHSPSELFA